jgi:hypothetical protein
MVAAFEHERESHDGDYRTHQTHGANAASAWADESASLVKAEDILTPEELAARPKVPDSWVYEKTRGRCRTFPGSSALAALSGSSALVVLAQLGRNRADSMPAARALCTIDWTAVATWLTTPAPLGTRSAEKRHARHHQDRLETDGPRTTINRCRLTPEQVWCVFVRTRAPGCSHPAGYPFASGRAGPYRRRFWSYFDPCCFLR